MSRIIENFDFSVGRRSKYDWDSIFDGNIYVLSRGDDFDCSVASFRTQAYNAARTRNGKLLTSIHDENSIVLKFAAAKNVSEVW